MGHRRNFSPGYCFSTGYFSHASPFFPLPYLYLLYRQVTTSRIASTTIFIEVSFALAARASLKPTFSPALSPVQHPVVRVLPITFSKDRCSKEDDDKMAARECLRCAWISPRPWSHLFASQSPWQSCTASQIPDVLPAPPLYCFVVSCFHGNCKDLSDDILLPFILQLAAKRDNVDNTKIGNFSHISIFQLGGSILYVWLFSWLFPIAVWS
jgi:hypothetical protein